MTHPPPLPPCLLFAALEGVVGESLCWWVGYRKAQAGINPMTPTHPTYLLRAIVHGLTRNSIRDPSDLSNQQ